MTDISRYGLQSNGLGMEPFDTAVPEWAYDIEQAISTLACFGIVAMENDGVGFRFTENAVSILSDAGYEIVTP